MVVWNIDNILISNVLGLQSVTRYSVTFRLYNILFGFIFVISTSIYSLMAKAFGGGNWVWINQTYWRLTSIISVVGGLAWLGGVLFLHDIVFLWTGPVGYSGTLTVFVLGGYAYLLSMVSLNSGLLTTFNYIKGVYLIGWLEALLKLGISWFLLNYLDVAGAAVGTFAGSLLSAGWILPTLLRRRSHGKIILESASIIRHFVVCLLPSLIAGILVEQFATDILARLTLGILIVFVYLYSSYSLLGVDTKAFVRITVGEIVGRVVRGQGKK